MAGRREGGPRLATVNDLVLGSGIDFDDRGAHRLKGVPGDWQLFEVVTTP